MRRPLTTLEIHLLRPVFKNTLRYGSIVCSINDLGIGGPGNSITPAGVPLFSKLVYNDDFSSATAGDQWVFVHEMTHVWQWGHGTYPANSAVGLWVQTLTDYQNAYPYDLTPGKRLGDFNIEQQASIVADYWGLLTKKLAVQNNNNKQATLSDYSAFIDELQKSGPSVRKFDQSPF